MKRARMILAIVLATVIFCSIPVSALNTIPSTSSSMSFDSTTESTVDKTYEIQEDLALRTANIKQFKNGGGYIAAVYANPVHYKDAQGVWQDIDNTLELHTAPDEESKITYYENKANSFKVRLPSSIKKDTGISVSYQGHTMTFNLVDDTMESVATVQVPEKKMAKSELLQEAQEKAFSRKYEESQQLKEEAAVLVENQNAELTYQGVLHKTDLKYQLGGTKLKETIVLSEPSEKETFSFAMHYTNMVPVVQEFGSVHFYAAGQEEGEPIFVIEAPYMEDSSENDTLSTNIAVSIQPTAYGCVYSLTPDKEWLRSPERVYPVMIDPTLTTSKSATDIQDNHVNQSDPNSNFRTTNRMYVGSNLSNSTAYESRAYIRFPRIAGITSTTFIAGATMYLNHHPTTAWQSADNLDLRVYDVGNNNWDSATMTWNTQKNYEFSQLICYHKTDKSYSQESFNVVSAVRKWYQSSTDNGLVIKPLSLDKTKTNRTCYLSSDCDYSHVDERPRITVRYYNPITITNGYYFIRNRETGRYIDLEGASTETGAPIQQWSFHGEIQSQWQLTRQSDGTYTIKSKLSGQYVSAKNNASQSSAKIVQTPASTGAGAHWYVYQSDTGAYIFVSKSSRFCAMSVPPSQDGNGIDLKQMAYTDNADYRDEWYLGRFIPDVPAEIYSNDDHLCIPTAITTIASYWGRHGYSGFGGLTTAQMETVGKNVAAAMRAAGGDAANAYIQNGFNIFSHKSGSKTYKLTTSVYEPANWSVLQSEINAGRPLMLGFASKEYDGGHMTACVGYEVAGGTRRVYLVDGLDTGCYVLKPFNTSENDYMLPVHITSS